MWVRYGKLWLINVKTESWSVEPVTDDSGLDLLYLQHTVTLRVYLNENAVCWRWDRGAADTSLRKTSDVVEGPNQILPWDDSSRPIAGNLDTTLHALTSYCMVPRRWLVIGLAEHKDMLVDNMARKATELQGTQVIYIAPREVPPDGIVQNTQCYVDISGGPTPLKCEVKEIIGDKAAIMIWTIRFGIDPYCYGKMGGSYVIDGLKYLVLSHRYGYSCETNASGRKTVVVNGVINLNPSFWGCSSAYVGTQFLSEVPLAPADMPFENRNLFIPFELPVFLGSNTPLRFMQIIHKKIDISSDGRRVQYQIMLEERPYQHHRDLYAKQRIADIQTKISFSSQIQPGHQSGSAGAMLAGVYQVNVLGYPDCPPGVVVQTGWDVVKLWLQMVRGLVKLGQGSNKISSTKVLVLGTQCEYDPQENAAKISIHFIFPEVAPLFWANYDSINRGGDNVAAQQMKTHSETAMTLLARYCGISMLPWVEKFPDKNQNMDNALKGAFGQDNIEYGKRLTTLHQCQMYPNSFSKVTDEQGQKTRIETWHTVMDVSAPASPKDWIQKMASFHTDKEEYVQHPVHSGWLSLGLCGLIIRPDSRFQAYNISNEAQTRGILCLKISEAPTRRGIATIGRIVKHNEYVAVSLPGKSDTVSGERLNAVP